MRVPGFNHDQMSMRFLLRHPVFLILMMTIFGWMSAFSTFAAPQVANGSVTLTWNSSTSTNIVAYEIYYGTASGVYNSVDYVTNSTNVTISGLVVGTTYYFAAAAVDALGDVSQFSNEIEYKVPNPFVATLAVVAPPTSGQFALNINGMTGSNYVVQVSTNLVNWTSVETNTAPFTFVDVDAGQLSQRFYRSFYLP